MNDHLERRETYLEARETRRVIGPIDIIHDDTTGAYRETLLPTDLRAALAELKQARAQLAEGNQRDRALALLLLRDGGQVEFTQAEQVNAPQHGYLISYPNLATGGLVLAYSADGETVDIAPPQETHR